MNGCDDERRTMKQTQEDADYDQKALSGVNRALNPFEIENASNAHLGRGHLRTWLLAILGFTLVITTGQAQVFTTIKSFGILTNVTGFNPLSTLVQGPDG